MMNIALIVIYNHQYNKNIEYIEQLYKGRFSDIYHLVPFYNGKKSNVIPVYENSYYFQGYVSQGFSNYYNEKYSHYFFVADDLILNPIINEHNCLEVLSLNENSSFLPGFITLSKREKYWVRVLDAYKWNLNVKGVEAHDQLPPYDVAMSKFNKFNLEIKDLRFNQIWDKPNTIKKFLKMLSYDVVYPFRWIHAKITNKSYKLSYPLVGSYSDIFVVSKDSINQFCHYCGVFATTELFVEIALPTSLVLSSESITTERELNYKGKALWTKDEFKELDKFENSLNQLLKNFPENYLYIHPIKLSKWHKS